MNLRRYFLLVTSLVTLLISVGLALPNDVQGGSPATNIITSYATGANTAPTQLVLDGTDLWFTAPGANAIGQMATTPAVSVTLHAITTANSQPYDLAVGTDTIWFTQFAANKIGALNINTGIITDYDIPTPNSEPTGIAVAPDGSIWFLQSATSKLTRFDPVSPAFTEYPVVFSQNTPASLGLEDVAVSPSGTFVWFTAVAAKRLVSYNTSADLFTDVPMTLPSPPFTVYTPHQVELDTTGNVWVSTLEGRIGRYSPTTTQIFAIFPVATDTSHITGLFWRNNGGNNQLWFSESNTGFAGQITIAPGGNRLSLWRFLLTPGSGAYGITADTNDVAWVVDRDGNAIKSWAPPYFINTYLPAILNP